LILATVVAACSLSLGLGLPPGTASAAAPCWKAVIADWSKDGTIDRKYATSCYRRAMRSAPTDLKVYSTLEDDLQRALASRSSRRLAGVHAPTAMLDAAGGSPSLPLLIALIAGLGTLLAACSLAAALVRRRRALR
jgi:hypothetical protein